MVYDSVELFSIFGDVTNFSGLLRDVIFLIASHLDNRHIWSI